MDINLSPDIRLSSDSRCWMLKRKRMRTNKQGARQEEWEAFNWFSSATSAIQAAANIMVRESDAETFTEALVYVEKMVTSLTQVLTPHFEVNLKDGAE